MTERGTESVDERLARLARATAEVRPAPELTKFLMDRVDAEPALLGPVLWRVGRVALAGFAAAALACLVWSWQAQASTDEELLATFDVMEIEP